VSANLRKNMAKIVNESSQRSGAKSPGSKSERVAGL
jgi:hypothetical protein